MSRAETETPESQVNINLKVSRAESAAFRAWCGRNSVSQVAAFREGFRLLRARSELTGEGGR